MLTPDALFLLAVAFVFALGLGALRLGGRRPPRRTDAGPALAEPPPSPERCQGPLTAQRPGGCSVQKVPDTFFATASQGICSAFHAWLAEDHDGPQVWPSFDQLIRETLSTHLGATRVRCFHLPPAATGCEPGAPGLQSIDVSQKRCQEPFTAQRRGGCSAQMVPDTLSGSSLREGLLGHVATVGMEYVAADPSHGPLLDDLAARTEDRWSWIWPVRESRRAGTTIGLIAVGRLADAAVLTPELRHAIGPLLSLCWQYVAARERLNLVRRTDRASGVLTRNDFFVLAHEALCDSYRANEPVVLAVLVLEGLRRLDDTRCWRERDELIERLGQLIAHRARSDDVVGRFTDDRFVILLRRLDSGLGRLIAEKMLSAANACLGRPMGSAGILPAQGAGKTPALSVRLRLGLAGSGFAQPPLQKLLSAAFDAVERARKENVPLATDLGAKRCQEPFAAERPRGCSAPEVPDTFLPTEDPQP